MEQILPAIGHLLGLDNATGPYYLFWSGFGGDLTELIALVIFFRRLRRHFNHKPTTKTVTKRDIDTITH